MTTVCEGEYPPPASIRLLPILDLNPSDVTCIYSTLLFLRKQADYLNIPTACVTFDQPLYIKAVDIVRNDNLDIVIRLGGFHTAMNFMGAIGSNMRGSGLEEVFEIIYGKKTVEHVMTGKAYMRAMRGHTLVTGALSLIVMQNLIPNDDSFGYRPDTIPVCVDEARLQELLLSDDSVNNLKTLYTDVLQHKVNFGVPVSEDDVVDRVTYKLSAESLLANESLAALDSNFHELCAILAEQSRTSKLWAQYATCSVAALVCNSRTDEQLGAAFECRQHDDPTICCHQSLQLCQVCICLHPTNARISGNLPVAV